MNPKKGIEYQERTVIPCLTRYLFVLIVNEEIPAFAGMTCFLCGMTILILGVILNLIQDPIIHPDTIVITRERSDRGDPVIKKSGRCICTDTLFTGLPRFARNDISFLSSYRIFSRHTAETRYLFAIVVNEEIPAFAGMTFFLCVMTFIFLLALSYCTAPKTSDRKPARPRT